MNMLIFRNISNWLNDEKNEIKVNQLVEDLASWDFKIFELVKRYEAWKWKRSTMDETRTAFTVAIKQKLSHTLATQITHEIMWNLISEVNKKLQFQHIEHFKEKSVNLADETNKALKELPDKAVVREEDLVGLAQKLTSNTNYVDSETVSNVLELLDISYQLVDNKKYTQARQESDVIRDADFAKMSGLAMGLSFASFNKQIQEKIVDLTKKNPIFAEKLGYSMGYYIMTFSYEIQERILKLAMTNDAFKRGFANGISKAFPTLSSSLRERVGKMYDNDVEFSKSVLSSVDKNFSVDAPSQDLMTKDISIKELSFESAIDVGFMLRPREAPVTKKISRTIQLEIKINAPGIEVEVEELDIISVVLGIVSMQIALFTTESFLGFIQISENFPWKIGYDIITSLEGPKYGNLDSKSSRLSSKNTSLYFGDGRFKCTVFMEGPGDILDRIQSVTYLLHPTFENPIINVYERNGGFPIVIYIWGEFRILIKVKFNDGHIELLSHWVNLRQDRS
jgi:YEATS family